MAQVLLILLIFGLGLYKLVDMVSIIIDSIMEGTFGDSTDAVRWIEYKKENPKTWPNESGKYLICRKDGKIHWETFNGSGWAYNGASIRFWCEINSPM